MLSSSVKFTKATWSILAIVIPAILYKVDLEVCVCMHYLVVVFNLAVSHFHNKMFKIKSACLMQNLIMEIQFFKEVDDINQQI